MKKPQKKAGKWIRRKFGESKSVEDYEWEILD